MKYTLLIALLFSAPLLAKVEQPEMKFETAEQKLAQAQARVDAAEAKVKEQGQRVEEASNKAGSYAGQHEQRHLIKSWNERLASNISAHHTARRELRTAQRALDKVKKEIIAHGYPVSEESGKPMVNKRQTKGEPIRMERPTPSESRAYGRTYRSRAAAAA